MSGEIGTVAAPSVEAAKEAARAAEQEQMNRRMSHHSLDATASPAYLHRVNSAPAIPESGSTATGDKSAIGKMAATLGSKFTDLTRLSLSMLQVIAIY